MGTTETARIAFVGAGNHATESLYPNIPQIPQFRGSLERSNSSSASLALRMAKALTV